MLKLMPLPNACKEEHFNLLQKYFEAQLVAAKYDPFDRQLIDHLEKSLSTILCGTPSQIEEFADKFVNRFRAFSDYAAKHKKGTAVADAVHKNTLAIINACFDYTWFSNRTTGWGAYALVEAYRLRICPYCQANHVNFHVEKVKGRRGAAAFRMRPPLDHYLPKSLYPYLAVSLSNLVPSCAQCNSGVKTANDPRGRKLAHPLDQVAVNIRFSTKGTIRKNLNGPVQVDDIVITINGEDAVSSSHAEEFRLQERYGWYRHEIKDLMDRDDQHRDLNRKLKGVVPREMYVLGFLEKQAQERSLGICLLDIYKELGS
ncbi:hypothetical protein [Delftia acidovorans]|uniref:hypothetical protein n=1 Tax=Delftia acidovorans TaxID=80866 RepID=UPI00286F7AE1|nr:hypothetical protein [Delftia acidovorans]